MLSKNENDTLTQTGPGTPMGDLMRRFWQPVALLEELPPGGAPLSVRIFSEDLVLFRDDRGQAGLLGMRCPHRGVDLSYGRIEDGGLRCIYHGWLFDIHGRCLEQPGEPPGSDFYTKIRHLAYPCREAGGIIFAYMGPGDPPLLPKFEALIAPEEQRFIRKVLQDSNYLNSLEGSQDPGHTSFLHKQLGEDEESRRALRFAVKGMDAAPSLSEAWKQDLAPTLEVDRTDVSIRMLSVRSLGPEQTYLRISTWVLPNVITAPGPTGGDGYTLAWHVPIDDTQSWRYSIDFRRSCPLDRETFHSQLAREMGTGYRPIRNRANRYLQDREQMKTGWFCGFGSQITIQDVAVTDLQGQVQDRTWEYLGYADKVITAARRMVLRAVRELQDGGEPAHVVRDEATGQFPLPVVVSEVFSSSEDWKTYCRRRIQEEEAASARTLGI